MKRKMCKNHTHKKKKKNYENKNCKVEIIIVIRKSRKIYFNFSQILIRKTRNRKKGGGGVFFYAFYSYEKLMAVHIA